MAGGRFIPFGGLRFIARGAYALIKMLRKHVLGSCLSTLGRFLVPMKSLRFIFLATRSLRVALSQFKLSRGKVFFCCQAEKAHRRFLGGLQGGGGGISRA